MGCDTTTASAELLGILEINDKSVSWLIRSQWGSLSYQLYVGACPMSDGGVGFQSGSTDCSTESKPYEVNSYTLQSSPSPLNPPTTDWTFNKKNQAEYIAKSWVVPGTNETYKVFKLSSIGSSLYMSGHSTVCECV